MQVPDKWWDEYENKKLEMRHRDPEKENVIFTRAALAMCENIDWNVGRIVEKVDELSLENNTIIIYMSDNGPDSWRWNGGMKGRKGSTDEGGVRSPFFMKWAGKIEEGKKVDEIAAAIDLLPTLSDIAGIEVTSKKPLDGVSLKPLILGEKRNWNERLIFSHWNNKVSVRSQKYRLDNENQLFDMDNDHGQTKDIAENYPVIAEQLIEAKNNWQNEVLAELDWNEKRPFTIGHPDFVYTQLPARDGVPHGNIERSNRYPNSSFFENWTSKSDSITWDVDVLADGEFEVEIYYTCTEKDTGAVFELSWGKNKLTGKISEPHDSTLKGMENDRVERMESYVKDFKPKKVGTIHLQEGKGMLILKATEIPGDKVMDIRQLILRRI